MRQLTTEEHEALERRANHGMARLSVGGAPLYPLACLVVGSAAGYPARYPVVFTLLAGAVTLLAVFRLYLVLRFERLYGARPRTWRGLFCASLIATLAIWTAISCHIVYDHGVGGVAFFSLLASVIMIDHSITVYTANRLLMAVFVTIVLVPHVAVLLSAGGSVAGWMALTALVYGVYVWITGRRLHASYWQGLADDRLLALRAAELETATAELADHRERLEALVQERTARLEEVAESLAAKNLELERNRDEIETKNAEMERFTYTVSHDLKSPLITVQGFLGLLEKDSEAGDTERVKRDLERIRSAVKKMGTLLEELLELSRIGRLMNPPEHVPLGELAAEAVEQVAGPIAEREVQVEIRDGLPVAYGDRVRLLEVFQNLIDNAVKFMGDAPQPRIEIGVRPGTEPPVLYVADNGLGIEPRYHDKVFELFERLGQADSSGTGIGLALVKRIVEVHGGRIWIESEGGGRGSSFCFTLPSPED